MLAPEREGRLQSAERAVPTCTTISHHEPSFSLTSCGLQAAMKGASHVSQSARRPPTPTAPQPRALQETRQRLSQSRPLLRPRRHPRLGRQLDRLPGPPLRPNHHSPTPRPHRPLDRCARKFRAPKIVRDLHSLRRAIHHRPRSRLRKLAPAGEPFSQPSLARILLSTISNSQPPPSSAAK